MPETGLGMGPALVTGASGFIGRQLVQALLQEHRRVIGLCRRSGDLGDLKHPLLQIATGDMESPSGYQRYLNGDVTVFHLAAVRSGLGASTESMRRINVAASVDLGRAAVRARAARFVYVSTALVYGASLDRAVTEADGFAMEADLHHYAQSRLQAILQMRTLVGEGLPLVTVYPTIVYGPDEAAHPNRVTSRLRGMLRSGVDLVIGGGHQKRNLVYVDDVVRGILLAERCGAIGDDFILGGDDISHGEFNRSAFFLAGRKPRVRISLPVRLARVGAGVADRVLGYDRRSGYQTAVDVLTREWRFGSMKAKKTLGYSWTPVQDGLRRTVRFIERQC